MKPLLQEVETSHTPESLVEQLRSDPGVVLLRSALFDSPQARYSLVASRPFLTLRSSGSRCELTEHGETRLQFGDPWAVLDGLMARYELLEELDLPFPLGGCFGYWGYDLKNFVEPRLPRRAVNDLELPDCHVGFYDSLVVFDHRLGKTWIVSTGLRADGSRDAAHAQRQLDRWQRLLNADCEPPSSLPTHHSLPITPVSNVIRSEFIAAIERAQRYIRAGDIYQVNLAQRLAAPLPCGPWEFYLRLGEVSPAAPARCRRC